MPTFNGTTMNENSFYAQFSMAFKLFSFVFLGSFLKDCFLNEF